MGSAVQSSPLTSTLTMRAFLELKLASLTLLSTTLWLDTPDSTERGRLRLSLSLTLSDRSLPDIILLTLLLREDFTMLESSLTLPCTLSLPLSTTVWLDTPDIIPMSTARGRLRPSLSTDTSPEFSPYVHHAGIHHGVVGYSGYHPYVYGKREAEAEPFYGYAAGVVPYVHHAAVVAPTGLGHAVAVTGYGHVTHSSNVGVCTNVAGVQVPC